MVRTAYREATRRLHHQQKKGRSLYRLSRVHFSDRPDGLSVEYVERSVPVVGVIARDLTE